MSTKLNTGVWSKPRDSRIKDEIAPPSGLLSVSYPFAMMSKLRQQIVQMAYNAGEGHIASALSILDILWTLYDKILPPGISDDKFILSKGHGSLALYVVLAEKRWFPAEHLSTFSKYDSILGGHPDRNKIGGVLASTGSLGHGFPMAVGLALAKKIKGAPGRVYCLVGDGECNEGSIWEAALLAAHHKLDNLYLVVDHNHSTDRAVRLEGLAAKFESFGFNAKYVSGHNQNDLEKSLSAFSLEKPSVVVAETIKGYGCKRMSSPEWHHRAPTEVELSEILKELECANS